jgi:hypothetical protein
MIKKIKKIIRIVRNSYIIYHFSRKLDEIISQYLIDIQTCDTMIRESDEKIKWETKKIEIKHFLSQLEKFQNLLKQ